MATRSEQKIQKLQQREFLDNHWQATLIQTIGKDPLNFLFSICCSPCQAYRLRLKTLNNEPDRFQCCNGAMPCSGKMGESSCPKSCICIEACCCFALSVTSTRFLIQDMHQVRNTKCDNCIIATMIWFQYLSCICNIIACLTDSEGIDDAAELIDCIAECLWCSVCGCIQTQHIIQLKAAEKDPSLIRVPLDAVAPLRSGAPQQQAPPMYPGSNQQPYGYGGAPQQQYAHNYPQQGGPPPQGYPQGQNYQY